MKASNCKFSVKIGMFKKDLKMCVYKISFTNYNKIYVGSSCRWPYRRREHLYDLKKNKHHNRYLQRAYNKYGLSNINIDVLEFCNSEIDLREREQYWINFFDTTNPKMGFNLVKIVNKTGTIGYKFTDKQKNDISNRMKILMSNKDQREKVSNIISENIKENPNIYNGNFAAKTFFIFNPENELIEINNLCKFCRDKDLDYKKMYEVCYGRRSEYLGWKIDIYAKNKREKEYFFISPEGLFTKVINLNKFCKENDLPIQTMRQIHKEIGVSCRGWKKYFENGKIINRKGKNFLIETPQGNCININNLTLFCKENKIHIESLKRGFKSKGFKLIKSNFRLLLEF
jgi:group I intron endonuclease